MNNNIVLILRNKCLRNYKLIFVSSIVMILVLLSLYLEEEKSKYILVWTPSSDETHFSEIAKDIKRRFVKLAHCDVSCYVTEVKTALGYYTEFDAIVFHSINLKNLDDLPRYRSEHQLYIFASRLQSNKIPIENPMYDGFFNWSWTYKLDSDILSPRMCTKDLQRNEIVGPRNNMKWRHRFNKTINDDFVKRKKDLVAWCVSAKIPNHRLAQLLAKELLKFDLLIDIYKNCFNKNGPKKIADSYYFLLAFEDYDLVPDYLQEAVLHALRNYVVPIVFGSVNYTNFLPNGSYIDATDLTPEKLVEMMMTAAKDVEQYKEYFLWRNHYSVEIPDETEEQCKLCRMLHDKSNPRKTYWNFRKWWFDGDTYEQVLKKTLVKLSPENSPSTAGSFETTSEGRKLGFAVFLIVNIIFIKLLNYSLIS